MCFEGLINLILSKRCHKKNKNLQKASSSFPAKTKRKTKLASVASTVSDVKAARKLSARIDRQLQMEGLLKGIELKLLLLGTGESGKSTIMKQMKVIHNIGFHKNELLAFRKDIRRNLLESIQQLLGALSRLSLDICDVDKLGSSSDAITYTNEEKLALKDAVNVILRVQTSGDRVAVAGGTPPPQTPSPLTKSAACVEIFEESLIKAISLVWNFSGLKRQFDKLAYSSYILCQAPYFLDNVERILSSDYVPSVQDILRARIKTTGISETRFRIGSSHSSPTICMIDVGGQISERKKWIHCFENVTAILFCVSLSEYDQVLLEDSSQSRLLDSFLLFESVVNSQWFKNTIIVLFLNKMDLFRRKLAITPLSNYFDDYMGPPNDFQSAAIFLQSKFLALNYSGLPIYTHFTCATDTRQIETVFAAIKETILKRALKETGLL